MAELVPIAARERAITLDVLRGFALCGVMIGNMVLYSGRWAWGGQGPDPTMLDEIAAWFLALLVDSKAQTLLTFLFGFGFAVQLVRAEARGEPVMGLYLRRMVVLFGFGALHVTLLWWGDVTWTYAVAGFGLLGFVHASNRTRVIVGLILIFVPVVVVMTFPSVFKAAVELVSDSKQIRRATLEMIAALHNPDRAGLGRQHVEYALVWCTRIYAWYFFWTLGRFLLGYVAGQRRWFDNDGRDHLPVFRRMAVWGGAVAAVTTTVAVLARLGVLSLHHHGLIGGIADKALEQLGLLAMTVMYIGIVVLLMQRRAWRRVLSVLAPVGQMALTTYFSQSLICTFLFYGWGLGWAGEVGVADCVGIALAVFAWQIALAHVWLQYFRFGPLEWVWRSAVYLRRQPMRLG